MLRGGCERQQPARDANFPLVLPLARPIAEAPFSFNPADQCLGKVRPDGERPLVALECQVETPEFPKDVATVVQGGQVRSEGEGAVTALERLIETPQALQRDPAIDIGL